MATFVPAAPAIPPELKRQQAGAAAPQPIAASMTAPAQVMGDPIAALEAKVAELERWASDTAGLINATHPALAAYMVPIAQAGRALQMEVTALRERAMGGATQPPPGEVPAGPPAGGPAGGPAPAPPTGT